jgi:hypothetical protein
MTMAVILFTIFLRCRLLSMCQKVKKPRYTKRNLAVNKTAYKREVADIWHVRLSNCNWQVLLYFKHYSFIAKDVVDIALTCIAIDRCWLFMTLINVFIFSDHFFKITLREVYFEALFSYYRNVDLMQCRKCTLILWENELQLCT